MLIEISRLITRLAQQHCSFVACEIYLLVNFIMAKFTYCHVLEQVYDSHSNISFTI